MVYLSRLFSTDVLHRAQGEARSPGPDGYRRGCRRRHRPPLV